MWVFGTLFKDIDDIAVDDRVGWKLFPYIQYRWGQNFLVPGRYLAVDLAHFPSAKTKTKAHGTNLDGQAEGIEEQHQRFPTGERQKLACALHDADLRGRDVLRVKEFTVAVVHPQCISAKKRSRIKRALTCSRLGVPRF